MADGPYTVLVVDDEPDVVMMLRRRLEKEGYQVVSAPDGEQGLRMAQETRPDLILLDIMMPRMKGREVCARLKADPITADTPVIFLTALGLPDHVKAGMDLGAEDYIVKPVAPAVLRERIMVCLARHGKPPHPPDGCGGKPPHRQDEAADG